MKPSEIFKIRTKKQFEKLALEIFKFQAKDNFVYKKYIDQLGVVPGNIKHVEQIPFLPIEIFKTQTIVTKPQAPILKSQIQKSKPQIFLSSGTTGTDRSKHFVSDIKLYEQSFRKCFSLFYGDVKKYIILAFLPSYYENKNSSLLFMVNDLMKQSGKKESRFYKNTEQKIICNTLEKLLSEKKSVILFGVSYALLDLRMPHPRSLSKGEGRSSRLFVMETGGMKGRREEITREELHKILCEKFGVKKIHSEYGMTELLSQAYSPPVPKRHVRAGKGGGIFNSPPWMKILIRDPNDPFSFLPFGKSGAINIIDLANVHSCAFIATQDVGRVHKNGSFEVLGRMDNSDLRGCNLLAQ